MLLLLEKNNKILKKLHLSLHKHWFYVKIVELRVFSIPMFEIGDIRVT